MHLLSPLELVGTKRKADGTWEDARLTLDRVDNTKGYELSNIVLACRRCNYMKGSWLTSEQMLDAAKRYFGKEIGAFKP